MKKIFHQGPSLSLRMFIAVFSAIVLIFVDSSFSSFIKIRTYMDTLISPFYFLVNIPRSLLDSISSTLATKQKLELENLALRQELLLKSSDLQLLKEFKYENIRLRELLGAPLRKNEYKMVTQVISIVTDHYSNQVVIDKGSINGVYEGQPVISDRGVIGQVTALGKFTSRVVLICDMSHALPVQVLRNDIRAIAAGRGCTDNLVLDYFFSNADDIRVGDILVTSGLGGRFPEGYPAAIVTSVKVDNQRAYTIIHAKPTADFHRLRYLLLIWTDDLRGDYSQPHLPLEVDSINQFAQQRLNKIINNFNSHTSLNKRKSNEIWRALTTK